MTGEPTHTASKKKWCCTPQLYQLSVKYRIVDYVQPVTQHYESRKALLQSMHTASKEKAPLAPVISIVTRSAET